MNKAVFLDRDGVLVAENGHYNFKPEHISINEGAVEALAAWQQKGYMLIVITNQGGIAKGLYTHKHVKDFHKTLKDFFHSYGVKITDFFYCPHHERFGNCLCRKPNSLMLEKAMGKYRIDPGQSYFIGDTERDQEAGNKAGLTPILIEANSDLTGYVSLIK